MSSIRLTAGPTLTEQAIYQMVAAKPISASKFDGSWTFANVYIDGWIKHQSCAGVKEA